MYSDDNLVYIFTMLECIVKIFIYVENYTDQQDLVWANDQRDYNAVWAMLLVIGEESKKLDTGLKKQFNNIPWNNVAGMRNYLAHDYRGVDYERIWSVVHDHLPEMKRGLINMIDHIPYQSAMLIKALDSPYYQHIQYLREKLND